MISEFRLCSVIWLMQELMNVFKIQLEDARITYRQTVGVDERLHGVLEPLFKTLKKNK